MALKYLGTYIPPSLSQVFNLNFPPLLREVHKLLQQWTSGLHSLIGRCNILKMTILPKFLYLMQALPIHIPGSYFRQVHAAFTHFLWAGKSPRLQWKVLSLPKLHGGLALPEVRTYYWAAHLVRLLDWCRHRDSKLWIQVEQEQLEVPLQSLTALPTRTRRHPLVGTTIGTCALLFSQFSMSSYDSPLRPIIGHPKFEPGLRD